MILTTLPVTNRQESHATISCFPTHATISCFPTVVERLGLPVAPPDASPTPLPVKNIKKSHATVSCFLTIVARLGLPVVPWAGVQVADSKSCPITSHKQTKISCYCLLVSLRCCTARPACRPLDRSPGSGQRVLLYHQSKTSKNLMLLSLVFLPLLQGSACLSSPGQ
jgi:hypothetical protein